MSSKEWITWRFFRSDEIVCVVKFPPRLNFYIEFSRRIVWGQLLLFSACLLFFVTNRAAVLLMRLLNSLFDGWRSFVVFAEALGNSTLRLWKTLCFFVYACFACHGRSVERLERQTFVHIYTAMWENMRAWIIYFQDQLSVWEIFI